MKTNIISVALVDLLSLGIQPSAAQGTGNPHCHATGSAFIDQGQAGIFARDAYGMALNSPQGKFTGGFHDVAKQVYVPAKREDGFPR